MELLFWQKPAGTRKTSVLLFVDSRFINDSGEFGNMFVACIALAHALKKTNTDVTEQLTSNQIFCSNQKSARSADFLALWTLNPGVARLVQPCLNNLHVYPCVY